MATADTRPSPALINAAVSSLVSGLAIPTVGAAAALSGGTIGGTAICGILTFGLFDVGKLFYSSMVPSVSAVGLSMPREHFRGPLQVDMKSLTPEFDYNFTNISDGSKTFVRGNQPYERPCGSYRIALKVNDKYGNDNAWLGMTGTASGEWPVSYHGTAKHNALNIAEEGYKLSKGKRSLYGKGIYSTPELDVAKRYTTEFQYSGTSYICILQNRVNPKYLKVIPTSETGSGTYWLSAGDKDGVDETELLRPYGICLFKNN